MFSSSFLTLDSLAGSGSRARGGDFAQIIATLIASSVIIWRDDTSVGGGGVGGVAVANGPQPVAHQSEWRNTPAECFDP